MLRKLANVSPPVKLHFYYIIMFCFSKCMKNFWPKDGIRIWVLISIIRSIGIMQRYSYAVSIGRCLLSNYKSPNQPCKMSMREIRLSTLKIKKKHNEFSLFSKECQLSCICVQCKKVKKMAKNIERDRLANYRPTCRSVDKLLNV
jgi:hypothetical protein